MLRTCVKFPRHSRDCCLQAKAIEHLLSNAAPPQHHLKRFLSTLSYVLLHRFPLNLSEMGVRNFKTLQIVLICAQFLEKLPHNYIPSLIFMLYYFSVDGPYNCQDVSCV